MPDARPPTLFVSTPTTRLEFSACVLPVARHRAFQTLFGYEGQLSAFEAGLRAAGTRCLFLPAPEIFGHPVALARLRAELPPELRQGGAQEGPGLVHLRFGAVRAARLLKGAVNLFVAGEDAAVPPIDLGRHPFGAGDVLPRQMQGVLAYAARRRALRAVGGAAVDVAMLPEAAVSADLDLAGGGAGAGVASGWPALQVQSLAEFSLPAWGAPWDQAATDEPPALRSADLHAALAGATPRRLIAVPWNLAHPGGIVADLVVKMARRQDPAVALLLLPFNVDGDALEVVARLAGHVRQATGEPQAALASVFVGRLRRLRNAQALCRLAPTAWLDGSDPETAWTRLRLARLGIAGILLAGDIGAARGEGVSAIFPADALRLTDLHTAFGRQQQRSWTVSARALGTLLALGGTLGAAPPPPRSRAAVEAAMRPLSRLLLAGASR